MEEERGAFRGGAAEDEVGAAAGADLAAVELELAGAKADVRGGGVEPVHLEIVGGPVGARFEVHLDHAGVGGKADGGQPGGVVRRGVAGEDDVFEVVERLQGVLDGADEGDVAIMQ